MNGEKKTDSYYNTMTGLGKITADKNVHTEIGVAEILTDEYLSQIDISEGLAGRIVSVIPEDGIRNGYTLYNDKDGKLEKELAQRGFNQAVLQAWKYARLYRGGLVVAVTPNGTLEEPLPKTNPGEIKFRVYSAARITVMESDINRDPKSPYFEDVELFRIRTKSGVEMNVHRNRCMVFKGEQAPDYNASNLELTYQYWGLSALQKAWNKIKYYGSSEQGIANAMQEFSVGKYTLENLASILAMNNKEAIDKIIVRLEAMNLSKSIMNAVLLGKNEKYERDNITFAGIPEILDRQMMSIASVTGIPVTKLFGRSAAGLNATGENDLRQYYDDVRNDQISMLKPEMNRMINYIGKSVYGGKGEYFIEDFNSLWEPTEREYSETQRIKAETYKIYMEQGVLTPEDVQRMEFPDLLEGGI